MEQQSKSAMMAVVAQAAAVAGYVPPTSITPSLIEHAGTGVDDLRRVSFTVLEKSLHNSTFILRTVSFFKS